MHVKVIAHVTFDKKFRSYLRVQTLSVLLYRAFIIHCALLQPATRASYMRRAGNGQIVRFVLDSELRVLVNRVDGDHVKMQHSFLETVLQFGVGPTRPPHKPRVVSVRARIDTHFRVILLQKSYI